MDASQQRIADDLAGSFSGELRFDRIARALYGSDASLYEILPIGIAFPHDVEDVVTLARYAEETNLPLIPRGAGTGLAGGAIGRGLVVDFSRHMTRFEPGDGDTVRVQPGVVRTQLNRALSQEGRYFPPDPSNSAVSTIGGMLGVDAAGSHAVRVGSTRDHVRSLEIVLIGGHRFEAGEEPLPRAGRPHDPLSAESAKQRIISRVAHAVQENGELIQARQPAAIRNCAGYHLRSILVEQRLSLPRLLVGSEGTLAMFTEAVLHTSPLPASRGVALLLFGRMDSAIEAVQAITEQQPSACDLLDRRLLSLGREWDPRFERLIPQSAEAGLLIEQTAYTEPQARQRIRMAADAARAVDSSMRIAAEAYSEEDIEFLWSLPRSVVPNLIRLVGETRPIPFVEDIAVPPEQLSDVLRRVQHVLQKHRVTASLYAHAASGQVHLRPFLPLPKPADGAALESLARELYDVVLRAGGTISGEHGDGLSRTAFLRSQYGPLYRVFREIKDIFDPHNLLNPGKIVSDDPHLSIKHFRPVPLASNGAASLTAAPAAGENPAAEGLVDLQLNWSPQELAAETLRCNGCGVCRTTEPGLRMCPFFRLDAREEASPRAKVNALRSHLTRFISPAEMTGEEMKQLASLCFNCKQCQLECPSNVNVPQMMIEAKAQYVAANGLRRGDWILSRAHSFGALGSALAPASNWLLNQRGARWLLEKLFGIARGRKLPRFAPRSYLGSLKRQSKRRPAAVPRDAVIYFVDHFANYHDTQIAFATVRLLEHLGTPVHVPPGQTASGMALISAGDLDGARELALQNTRMLAQFAREGHAIICTEPAAVIALTQEYPRLIDHPDVAAVATHAQDAGAWLLQRLSANPDAALFNSLPLKAAYHTPCHTRALYGSPPWLELLQRIPDLQLTPIEKGCSGMAGAFGLTRENFETSIAIGAPLMERMAQGDLQIGVTECSSCKLQMEQGTSTPTVHPIKLLALALGLIPEARLKLTPNTKRWLTT